jgi:hypothetical protein
VYHAGGLAHKKAKGHWRELIWNVDEMKEMRAKGGETFATKYPMSYQFLNALDAQNEVAKRRGVRQIIRIYGIDAGNQWFGGQLMCTCLRTKALMYCAISNALWDLAQAKERQLK